MSVAPQGSPAWSAAEWAARWDALWRALGAPAPHPVDELLARYDEPHRAYHTRAHLAECLARLDAARARAARPAEAECALWYHDAVYDPRAADNEARSADLAAAAMARAGMAPAAVARVRALVMATRHEAPPAAGAPGDGEDAPAAIDAALVVDADLGILAADAARFAEYERAVRVEYAWVPPELFRARRAAILETFLRRPRIFTSGAFDDDDARARTNLAHAISSLRDR